MKPNKTGWAESLLLYSDDIIADDIISDVTWTCSTAIWGIVNVHRGQRSTMGLEDGLTNMFHKVCFIQSANQMLAKDATVNAKLINHFRETHIPSILDVRRYLFAYKLAALKEAGRSISKEWSGVWCVPETTSKKWPRSTTHQLHSEERKGAKFLARWPGYSPSQVQDRDSLKHQMS